MKRYKEYITEKSSYKLTVKDSKELNDFLIHVSENMENEPNLLRSAYARIRKVLFEIKKGNYTKSALSFLLSSIYHFIEGNRNIHDLRLWSEKLMEIDTENYDVLLTIINEYNHILNKKKSELEEQVFNIKSWAFEKEGLEPIGESIVVENHEDYCDFGCGYIRTYLDNNPDINEDEFAEYVTVHNKADRDMGELQDISKEEIERLGKEFKKELKENKIYDYNVTVFGLEYVPELFIKQGYDEKSARIMKKLAIRAFNNKGDEGVIDFLKNSLGVEVFNVRRGKYSFEPYS